jgi:hypothetical protein
LPTSPKQSAIIKTEKVFRARFALQQTDDRKLRDPVFACEGKLMRKEFVEVVVLMFSILFNLPVQGQEEVIKKGESLDMQRCIRIALARHPAVLSATSTVIVNESRIGQARSGYLPQVGLSSSYFRTDSHTTPAGTVTQQAGNVYNQYGKTVTLNQNIYDFSKTAVPVEVQNLNTAAVTTGFGCSPETDCL